jgi:hypothetical protein
LIVALGGRFLNPLARVGQRRPRRQAAPAAAATSRCRAGNAPPPGSQNPGRLSTAPRL